MNTCTVGEVGEGRLSRVLKGACAGLCCSRNELAVVLSVQRDPYRGDREAGHRAARGCALRLAGSESGARSAFRHRTTRPVRRAKRIDFDAINGAALAALPAVQARRKHARSQPSRPDTNAARD